MAVACEVEAGQFSVRGLSLGGVETCMQVPQLGLLFDVGHAPRSFASTPRLFITHGHADHCGGLIAHLSNRMLIGLTTPLQVYAPASICDGLRQAVGAFESIQAERYRWELNPLSPGDEVDIGGGRFVRAFPSVHVITTLGYTAWERVRKLKPEFLDLPGQEIARRKRAGEDLFDVVERPLLSFPGDTAIGVLDRQPHLLETRVLILETTYLDDRKTVAQCLDHGHIHLDQVLSRADSFDNEHLVLTHFSQSYRPAEVVEILAARTTVLRPRVHPLVPESASWPG